VGKTLNMNVGELFGNRGETYWCFLFCYTYTPVLKTHGCCCCPLSQADLGNVFNCSTVHQSTCHLVGCHHVLNLLTPTGCWVFVMNCINSYTSLFLIVEWTFRWIPRKMWWAFTRNSTHYYQQWVDIWTCLSSRDTLRTNHVTLCVYIVVEGPMHAYINNADDATLLWPCLTFLTPRAWYCFCSW